MTGCVPYVNVYYRVAFTGTVRERGMRTRTRRLRTAHSWSETQRSLSSEIPPIVVTLLVSIYDNVVSVQLVSLTLIGKGESRALLAAMSSLIPSLSGLGFPPKIILERPSVLTGLDSDPAMGAFNESNPARVPRGDLWDGATV